MLWVWWPKVLLFLLMFFSIERIINLELTGISDNLSFFCGAGRWLRMKDGQLDETDRKILRVLAQDGRVSNQKLADTVHLSPTPCWNRVKALEEAGFISGYAAILDQHALGLPDVVIIEVTLDRHDDDIFRRFGEALAELPEVMEAYLITGEYDYLVKVAVSGTEGYERFLRQKLYKLPGIRHSRSTFALRCLKRVHSVVP